MVLWDEIIFLQYLHILMKYFDFLDIFFAGFGKNAHFCLISHLTFQKIYNIIWWSISIVI